MDKQRCPICQGNNYCAVEENSASCWCMSASISEQALSQLPDDAKTCICQACAEKYGVVLKTV